MLLLVGAAAQEMRLPGHDENLYEKRLIDISDRSKPSLISHYDTGKMATGICVSGDLAFIATCCYGVGFVDVSNPRKVCHVSTLKPGEARP